MIQSTHFSEEQRELIFSPIHERIYLQGLPGTGKTTAAVQRVMYLISERIAAESILIITPQKTLRLPYQELINHPKMPPGGLPHLTTISALGQQMIQLFWPVLVKPAGFKSHERSPVFLSIETSQYYLEKIISPMLDQGFFESIVIDKNRLLGQMLDTLNKAAIVGFPHTEIADRLIQAWNGKPGQSHIYEVSQLAVNKFRDFCLEKNLIDFSLGMEIFSKIAWNLPICRDYLKSKYQHIVFDNIEEDTPAAHKIVREWMTDLSSCLLITDTKGGYRTFLGADTHSASQLEECANISFEWSKSFLDNQEVRGLGSVFEQTIEKIRLDQIPIKLKETLEFSYQSYIPDTIHWVIQKVKELVQIDGIPPGELAILSPYLSDSLRFSLVSLLAKETIPVRTHRPSRALNEEPATLALITLAKLAHPQWNLLISKYEFRSALMQFIEGLDLIRADLLAQIVHTRKKGQFSLHPFDKILPSMQERITFSFGVLYERLRIWLDEYHQNESVDLDIFFSKLFGEILSQPGYGFHNHFQNASIVAKLIHSAIIFRKLFIGRNQQNDPSISMEFIALIEEGVMGNQYLGNDDYLNQNSVFIAPAYTYLMINQPVSYQFWLDIGSLGWWERINQPLTHPVVLSNNWVAGTKWTDADEYYYNQRSLQRIISGLLNRCRKKVYLCATGINQRGDEERGPLLQAIQRINRAVHRSESELS